MKMHHLVEAESIWALSQKGTVNLPQVKTLQDKLRAAGHDPGASDGWYGQKTANAVRSYQQANNLTVDGDAGPQTLASLGMGGANTTPPAETPPAETPPAPAPRQAATEPEPTQTEPEPTQTEPEPTQTEPEPTQTEPEPTQTEPEPTQTEPEPEEVSITGTEGAAQLISKFDATQLEATINAFGSFEENGATHMIFKAKQSSVDPNVAIIVANRRSGKTDAELEKLGIPRNGSSIYAFDLSPGANIGNDLPNYTARNFDQIFEVFNTIDIESGTYRLVAGSTRAKFKGLLKSYIYKEVNNESIQRISKLAGL